MDDGLMVKRIARAPGPGRIAVISDNPQYRSWDDLPMAAVQLVGRVVWTGRRVRCRGTRIGGGGHRFDLVVEHFGAAALLSVARPAERRVGTECVSTGRSRC